MSDHSNDIWFALHPLYNVPVNPSSAVLLHAYELNEVFGDDHFKYTASDACLGCSAAHDASWLMLHPCQDKALVQSLVVSMLLLCCCLLASSG